MLFALFVVRAAPGLGGTREDGSAVRSWDRGEPRATGQVMAPSRPRLVYDVSVSGFSRRRAKAYLFIDYQGCAKSFGPSRAVPPASPTTYSVKGLFRRDDGLEVLAGRN